MKLSPELTAKCLLAARAPYPPDRPSAALSLELPYPPTVNTYWRNVRGKVLLSAKARNYRRDVLNMLRFRGIATRTGPLAVTIVFHAPDRKRRDLDNLPKGLLDSLKYALVYGDDSQVRELNLSFGDVVKGGRAVVTITAASSSPEAA